MKEKLEGIKGNKKLLIMIIVVLLAILSIVGITYAYFTAVVMGNEDAKTIIVTTPHLHITYESGNEILAENAVPGWNDSKEIKVTNNSSIKVYYDLIWTDITNTFEDKNDLVYSISGHQTKSNTPNPIEEDIMIGNIGIEPGVTHTYTLRVDFLSQGRNQDINQGKVFMGKIEVRESLPPGSEMSNNRNLKHLSISGHTITPEFNPNTTNYTLTVPYEISSVTINAEAADATASVTGTGTRSVFVGDNFLFIYVTAQDGTDRSYLITVRRAQSR